MRTLLQDFRYALRSLAKDIGFTLPALVALALGIGSSTAVFSVVYNCFLNPFPYSSADRLVTFSFESPEKKSDSGISMTEFLQFRSQNQVFEDLLAAQDHEVLYSNLEGTEQLEGLNVTGNTFELLGVKPSFGRWLTEGDAQPGAPPVVVISHRLWSAEFKSDPHIVGSAITLNELPMTVVGIMPPRFEFLGAEVYMPLELSPGNSGLHSNEVPKVWCLGRLKRGITLRLADADLDVIAHRLSKIYPEDFSRQFVVSTSLFSDVLEGNFRDVVYVLLAAVAMLLLISCSNVANLLLARATAREREIAIRHAIGASRGRLIRQLLAESAVLAAIACFAGCVFAYFGLKGLMAIIPSGSVPAEAVVSLNPVVLLFAVGASAVTTIICGIVPAVYAVRDGLSTRLAGDARGGIGTQFRYAKFRSFLIIVEVSLSIALLDGAGLMMRSFFALTHVDLGFEPHNILVAQVRFPDGVYDTAARRRLFLEQVLSRIRALPGVKAATESFSFPPYNRFVSPLDVVGKVQFERRNALVELCDYGYLQTLGARLLQGRFISTIDVDANRKVAVINQEFATMYFANQEPIGTKIKFSKFDDNPNAPHNAEFEIIGIIANVKNQGVKSPSAPEAYVPLITASSSRNILVKTEMNPLVALESIRREVWAVDPNVALTSVDTIDGALEQSSYAQPEFGFVSLTVFALIALILVSIGVFSVMAFAVSLRTHEIGIRMALGAQRADILRMVLSTGIRLIAVGIASGVLASFCLSRFLQSQLWNVSSTDPWTLCLVIVVIVATGLGACLVPAWRAAAVDPLVSLHHQ